MQALLTDLQTAMSKLQYIDQPNGAPEKPAIHSEFLRTGRIDRNRPTWSTTEKRHLTYEEVAARTGKILTVAGERTHERLNNFHRSIQFPKLVFHRTLSGTPHLGYCHVTASKSKFAEFEDVKWAFYIANFFADIAPDELKFEAVNMRAERMYFAVAVERDGGCISPSRSSATRSRRNSRSTARSAATACSSAPTTPRPRSRTCCCSAPRMRRCAR